MLWRRRKLLWNKKKNLRIEPPDPIIIIRITYVVHDNTVRPNLSFRGQVSLAFRTCLFSGHKSNIGRAIALRVIGDKKKYQISVHRDLTVHVRALTIGEYAREGGKKYQIILCAHTYKYTRIRMTYGFNVSFYTHNTFVHTLYLRLYDKMYRARCI